MSNYTVRRFETGSLIRRLLTTARTVTPACYHDNCVQPGDCFCRLYPRHAYFQFNSSASFDDAVDLCIVEETLTIYVSESGTASQFGSSEQYGQKFTPYWYSATKVVIERQHFRQVQPEVEPRHGAPTHLKATAHEHPDAESQNGSRLCTVGIKSPRAFQPPFPSSS